MANAVFNSMEDYFSRGKLRPRVPYTKFDLSHIRSMDCDMGILYPFYIEDCVPGDRFKISQVVKLQALPLKNPLFNNVKIYTYYFFCPYYLLWHNFDRFIEGGRDGTYTAELPYVEMRYQDNVDYYLEALNFMPNSLWDYLGFQPYSTEEFPSGPFHSVRVSAFPFAAYQRIYRDYFMNQDVQTQNNVNNWYPEDDFDFVLHDGLNIMYGEGRLSAPLRPQWYPYRFSGALASQFWNDMHQPYLTLLRPKNWNKDYFTSAMFSPQRGPMQALGTNSTLLSPLVAVDNTSYDFRGPLNLFWNGSGEHPRIGIYDSATDGPVSHASTVAAMTQLISTGNFTISELHLAQQIELWMERNMSVKAQYNEFLRIHFNDAPLDLRLTKPDYIGGDVQDVQISNVLQTSSSTSSSPQGTLAGNGSSYGSGYIGSYHVHEYGIIMGIMAIMPEAYYCSGIDRHWTKQSRYDFYFPEFADLEPQAILRKELFSVFDTSTHPDSPLDQVFGYVGRNDEYRHHRSLAVGALRNRFQADFASWVIQRNLPSVTEGASTNEFPYLNDSFIDTHVVQGMVSSPAYYFSSSSSSAQKVYYNQISHDAWASGKTVNPFIAQIGLSVSAVRPMPYVSDPSRISM